MRNVGVVVHLVHINIGTIEAKCHESSPTSYFSSWVENFSHLVWKMLRGDIADVRNVGFLTTKSIFRQPKTFGWDNFATKTFSSLLTLSAYKLFGVYSTASQFSTQIPYWQVRKPVYTMGGKSRIINDTAFVWDFPFEIWFITDLTWQTFRGWWTTGRS